MDKNLLNYIDTLNYLNKNIDISSIVIDHCDGVLADVTISKLERKMMQSKKELEENKLAGYYDNVNALKEELQSEVPSIYKEKANLLEKQSYINSGSKDPIKSKKLKSEINSVECLERFVTGNVTTVSECVQAVATQSKKR